MLMPARSEQPQMPGPSRRRQLWRSPLGALALALISVGLGTFGYARVTAEPTHPIDFVIEEGLPYGITQESVEAAAEDRALSHQPFTMAVVERELDRSETRWGELGEADVLLSVGDDHEDPDLVAGDATRVAFSGEETLGDNIQTAQHIREAFTNNRTLGHGPSAVVGAAMTAADMKVDSANRSAAWWASLAALPMVGAVLMMFLWWQDRRVEQRRARLLADAQLALAQVVLELDALQVRFETAKAALQETGEHQPVTSLQQDWSTVRRLSLDLARREQALVWIFEEQSALEDGHTMDQAVEDLTQFAEDAQELKRRADALADAAEVRAGHAGARSVLGRLALPLIQAVDEILGHRGRFPDEADQLEQQRDQLLALLEESAPQLRIPGEVPSESEQIEVLAAQHHQLLTQWRRAEQQISRTATGMTAAVERGAKNSRPQPEAQTVPGAADRARRRISAMTAGATDSLHQLRGSLGLGGGEFADPQHAVEEVLEALDRQRTQSRRPDDRAQITAGALAVLAPVLLGLGTGAIAASTVETNTRAGLTLTGDQPLNGLQVYGDPAELPAPPEHLAVEQASHAESLDLEFLRQAMDDSGFPTLLPAGLDLTVALVPADEYLGHSPDPEEWDRFRIDYWELLDAQQQLKTDVADQYPDVLNPETGEVRMGQGILPVWLLEDDTYAVGSTLTGEISSGIHSRMGAYDFIATEPAVYGPGDLDIPIGVRIAYVLGELGRTMEYNHQETSNASPRSVFWMAAVTAWAGLQTALIIGVAIAGRLRHRVGSLAARRELRALRTRLHELALGLDLSRLDMVAVLGGESPTGGRAELAEQRLYESSLATAWRQVRALERLPRRQQRGEEWQSAVQHVQDLVDTLASRDLNVSQRAEALLRSQRSAL